MHVQLAAVEGGVLPSLTVAGVIGVCAKEDGGECGIQLGVCVEVLHLCPKTWPAASRRGGRNLARDGTLVRVAPAVAAPTPIARHSSLTHHSSTVPMEATTTTWTQVSLRSRAMMAPW